MSANKNQTLELFKLIASYMVVFIHVLFYGEFGIAIDALARFAVPLFFGVSGFYSYQASVQKIKKRFVSVFRLYLFSALLYTLCDIAKVIFDSTMTTSQYLLSIFNTDTLVRLFILNVPMSSTHLWYLLALIYMYGIFYLATKFAIKERVMFVISFILLLLHLVLGEGLSIFGIQFNITLVRNFLLMGIPFFGIGMLVRKHKKKFETIPNYISLICLVVGIVETLLSRKLFEKNELYVGSLFILFAIIVIFIKYSQKKYPPFLMVLANCSTYIYILHIFVTDTLTPLFLCININTKTALFEMIYPILVCIISTLLAYIMNTIKLKYQHKKNLCVQTKTK